MKSFRNSAFFGLLISGFFLAGAFGTAFGEELPAPEVDINAGLEENPSLGLLMEAAYEQNPSIQAAREGWRAALEGFRVTTGYPDPQFMITYFPEPIRTRLGPQDFNATLSQPIPFPGKLKKAGEAVEAGAELARLMLDKTVREVSLKLQESLWELYYIREAQAIARANAELIEHLRTVGETAHADDRALFSDMVKAQSQAGQLRYDQLMLADLEATEIARINGLLDREPDAPIGTFTPGPRSHLAYSLEDLYVSAQEGREEIRMEEIRALQADLKTELAHLENMPDFKVGIFYAAIGHPDVMTPPPDAGQDAVGLQFGFEIPLWSGKNKGRVAVARAEAEKARAQKRAEMAAVRTSIREIWFRMENARRLMELYEKNLLPQAEHSLSLAETWFRAGESDYSDMIETQSVRYNFQLSLARARADYEKWHARLTALAGTDISHRALDPDSDPDSDADRDVESDPDAEQRDIETPEMSPEAEEGAK